MDKGGIGKKMIFGRCGSGRSQQRKGVARGLDLGISGRSSGPGAASLRGGGRSKYITIFGRRCGPRRVLVLRIKTFSAIIAKGTARKFGWGFLDTQVDAKTGIGAIDARGGVTTAGGNMAIGLSCS